MKVLIGFDHRGHEAASHLADRLRAHGHESGAHGPQPGETCDYPEIAAYVGRAVVAGEADVGVLIDASGVGMAIAANKVLGVRAASVHDEITAELSKAHTDANVICLSADLLGHRLMEKIIELYLQTTFEGGRHQRRIDKITEIERTHGDT
ncbi:MAG: RpiB/LacA/LacB family sugar-phosphate isomerase [Planctomycetota bacterium]